MAIKKQNLIIGRQPLLEAVQAGRAIDKILLQKNATGETAHAIRQIAKEYQIPVQMVPVEKLNGITKANHQGVIAFAALVQYMDLQQVIDHVVGEGQTGAFVLRYYHAGTLQFFGPCSRNTTCRVRTCRSQ